jgi:mannose-1-phosphate guanylyltransferase
MTSVVGRFMASDQASAVGVEIDMLVEPEARDTLPAIAAATEWVAKRDPESLLLILPSDQMISDVAAFAETGGVECPR